MFQCAQHAHLIVRMDGRCGLRVGPAQLFVHGCSAFFGKLCRQLLPQAGRRFFLGKAHPVQKALNIQARAAHENGQISPCRDFLFQRCGHSRKICHTESFVRRQDVHAVVRDAAGLLRRHLCGTDIQPLIDLHGIAADDLAGKAPCQRHAESGFACGSGAYNGYDRMFIRCVQTAFPAPFGSISVRRGVRAGRRAAPRRKGSFRPAPVAPAARTYPPL